MTRFQSVPIPIGFPDQVEWGAADRLAADRAQERSLQERVASPEGREQAVLRRADNSDQGLRGAVQAGDQLGRGQPPARQHSQRSDQAGGGQPGAQQAAAALARDHQALAEDQRAVSAGPGRQCPSGSDGAVAELGKWAAAGAEGARRGGGRGQRQQESGKGPCPITVSYYSIQCSMRYNFLNMP